MGEGSEGGAGRKMDWATQTDPGVSLGPENNARLIAGEQRTQPHWEPGFCQGILNELEVDFPSRIPDRNLVWLAI